MDALSDEAFAALVDRDLADNLDEDTHRRLRQPHNLERWINVLFDVEARVARRADDLFSGLLQALPLDHDELIAELDAYRRAIRMERKVRRRLIEALFLLQTSKT